MSSMSSLLLFSLIFLIFNFSVVFSQVYCDSYECDETTISTSSSYYCIGYESCSNSDITMNSGADIYCYGDDACYDSNLTTTNTGGIIYASGHYSAAYGILDGASHQYCYGFRSCYYSDIYSYSTYGLYCDGYQSCMYAEINDTVYVYGRSMQSLYGATIDSQGESTLYVYLYGYYAGQLLNIYCRDGSTCQLYCDGTGCYYTYFYCEEGATCSYSCLTGDDCISPDYQQSMSKSKLEKIILNKKIEMNKLKFESKLDHEEKQLIHNKNNNNNKLSIDLSNKPNKYTYNNNNNIINICLIIISISGWLVLCIYYIKTQRNNENDIKYQTIV